MEIFVFVKRIRISLQELGVALVNAKKIIKHTQTHTHTHIVTHTHTHKHTHKPTYTYTHTHIPKYIHTCLETQNSKNIQGKNWDKLLNANLGPTDLEVFALCKTKNQSAINHN